MSTAIIISIVVFFILILSGVGIYFYKKKKKDENEEEEITEETAPPTTDVNAEAPSQTPSSSIGSDDVMIGDSTLWNRDGKLICGITSPNKAGNLFCTDYSIDNRFKSMKKSCIDVDVDQNNKRIFCVDQATKKAQFLTIPANGLTEHKDDAKWNTLGTDKFKKVSVSNPANNIVALGDSDQKVYRYDGTGWKKMGDLVTSEIATLSPQSTNVQSTNVGYILAPNSGESNAETGFRIYGYGIQGSPSWFSASNWSGTKIDGGASINTNQPVVCHINKKNEIHCQTTSTPNEKIKLYDEKLTYDNINISGEKDLFLTTTPGKDVYYYDLQIKDSQGYYPGVKIGGVKFTKIAS